MSAEEPGRPADKLRNICLKPTKNLLVPILHVSCDLQIGVQYPWYCTVGHVPTVPVLHSVPTPYVQFRITNYSTSTSTVICLGELL